MRGLRCWVGTVATGFATGLGLAFTAAPFTDWMVEHGWMEPEADLLRLSIVLGSALAGLLMGLVGGYVLACKES